MLALVFLVIIRVRIYHRLSSTTTGNHQTNEERQCKEPCEAIKRNSEKANAQIHSVHYRAKLGHDAPAFLRSIHRTRNRRFCAVWLTNSEKSEKLENKVCNVMYLPRLGAK